MKNQQICPNCQRKTDSDAKICERCGLDFLLWKIAEESSFAQAPPDNQKKTISPEILVPKVGNYLVQKEAISEENLKTALAYQKDRALSNSPILIGEALVELGLIDRASLDSTITEQIIDLHNALKEVNAKLEQRVDERTTELNEALQKLTELNRMKSNFVSNISHELRTPLTHMAGYIELLLEESLGPINEGQKKAVKVIERSYARLFRLIDDLIQFSFISRGEILLEKNPIQVSKLISDTHSNMLPRAKNNNIQLDCLPCEDNIFVFADEEKLSWIINQILDNAIKFNQDSGKVTLEVQKDGNLISFIISDTGIGIPEKDFALLFEPFQQIDGSTNRKHGGLGNGLYLAQEILIAHGSLLEVSSIEGSGSIFRFSLPSQ